jgi:hypothetical protein
METTRETSMDAIGFGKRLEEIVVLAYTSTENAMMEVEALLDQVIQSDMTLADKGKCLRSGLSEKASLLYRPEREGEARACASYHARARTAVC